MAATNHVNGANAISARRVIAAGLVAPVAAPVVLFFPRKNAPTLEAHFDAPVYSSFEELAAASDAVVVGDA
ncbi:MAG: hypothetical protein H0U16_12315 [Actinobacteria bacterium]|nr:hypothetical protein [Actinomycetota bacterium]